MARSTCACLSRGVGLFPWYCRLGQGSAQLFPTLVNLDTFDSSGPFWTACLDTRSVCLPGESLSRVYYVFKPFGPGNDATSTLRQPILRSSPTATGVSCA